MFFVGVTQSRHDRAVVPGLKPIRGQAYPTTRPIAVSGGSTPRCDAAGGLLMLGAAASDAFKQADVRRQDVPSRATVP